MTSLSRPSASAPKQQAESAQTRERRIFGWDKHEHVVPAKSCVRFTCRPTSNFGDPQYRTQLIRVSELHNPDPARYPTLDHVCGHYARQMEQAYRQGTLDPTADDAWELFTTEVGPLPSFLSKPRVAVDVQA